MKESFRQENMSPPTNRSLELYLEDLDLDKRELEGKTILDIGAGTREFAKDIERQGIKAEVFSLDPHYADQGPYKEKIQEGATPRIEKKTIAGVGNALPFKDEVFDLIIAEYSLPFYANDRKQLKKFFEELRRVIKPNGEVRIYPMSAMGLMDIFVGWEIMKLKLNKEIAADISERLLVLKKNIKNFQR